jgi:hypothetical protein
MFRPQLITVNCAHCGFPFQIPVYSIIDVKQNPEMKPALLSGQLNAAQCPSCGRVNYIGGPLLYHDPGHDFLAVYIPMEANIPETERQKIIGELTNALMNALPAEERRGYMLTPQQFFDLETLIRKILEFDGVTNEMLEASSRKIELLDRMLNLQNDEMAFNMAVAENKELLDREFFMLIADAIERYRGLGEEDRVKALDALRERLMPLTEFGQRLLKQRKAVEALGQNPSRGQVLDAIVAGDMEEVEAITIAALPMLDYAFFQELTNRIEAASGEEREDLEAKRDLMLNLLETFRKLDEQAFQAASRVADELIKAEDLDAAIIELAPMIDERVLDVLLRDMQIAQREGATELAARIQQVLDTLRDAAGESMPPSLNLIFKLVDAEYPQETKALLEENRDQIDDTFLTLLDVFIKDIEQSDSYDPQVRDQLVRHLRNVATQAKLIT